MGSPAAQAASSASRSLTNCTASANAEPPRPKARSTRRGATLTGPADHRAGTQDQQSPDGPLAPLRDGSELALATCRLLQRCQPKPGGEVPPGAEALQRAGTRAVIAVAAIRPMPGIVMDHGKDSDEILTHRPAWLTGKGLSPNQVCTKPC